MFTFQKEVFMKIKKISLIVLGLGLLLGKQAYTMEKEDLEKLIMFDPKLNNLVLYYIYTTLPVSKQELLNNNTRKIHRIICNHLTNENKKYPNVPRSDYIEWNKKLRNSSEFTEAVEKNSKKLEKLKEFMRPRKMKKQDLEKEKLERGKFVSEKIIPKEKVQKRVIRTKETQLLVPPYLLEKSNLLEKARKE